MKTIKELGLTRVLTNHRNVNDCWCLVISQAIGRRYDEVRAEMRGFMFSDGSLCREVTTSYLAKYGFVESPRTKFKIVRDLMVEINQPIIIACYDRRKEMHHLVYAENNTLYTTSDTDECFYDPAFYYYYRKVSQ